MTKDWATYQDWHQLLDALCAEQGYLDNLVLAEALCAANGNRTQAAFDTAVKNLRNWRQGVHVPQRRNFLLLTRLLKIDRQAGLREHWNHLYGASRTPDVPEDIEGEAPPTPPDQKTWRKMQWALAGSAGCIIGLAGTIAYLVSTIPDPGATKATIDYHRNVSLKVGETMTIHGRRGSCGNSAPRWEDVVRELPPLTTADWSDGGEGLRYSKNCSSLTPARGVSITAIAPGVDKINLYGDDITIRVTD